MNETPAQVVYCIENDHLPGIIEELNVPQKLNLTCRTDAERDAFLQLRYAGVRSLNNDQLDLLDEMMQRITLTASELFLRDLSPDDQAKIDGLIEFSECLKRRGIVQ